MSLISQQDGDPGGGVQKRRKTSSAAAAAVPFPPVGAGNVFDVSAAVLLSELAATASASGKCQEEKSDRGRERPHSPHVTTGYFVPAHGDEGTRVRRGPSGR